MNELKVEKCGILCVRGHDQIGAAARATGFLSSRGANLIEENVQVLDIDFVCDTVVFTASDEQMKKIKSDVDTELKPHFSDVMMMEKSNVFKRKLIHRYELDVMAEDEPGIAATIEGIMQQRGINITEVRGRTATTWDPEDEKFVPIYTGTFRLESGNSRCVRMLQEDMKVLENTRHWELVLRNVGMPPMPGQIAEQFKARAAARHPEKEEKCLMQVSYRTDRLEFFRN